MVNHPRETSLIKTVKPFIQRIKSFDPSSDVSLPDFVENQLLGAFTFRAEHEEVPDAVLKDEDYRREHIARSEIEIASYVFGVIISDLIGKWNNGELQEIFRRLMMMSHHRQWNIFLTQKSLMRVMGINCPPELLSPDPDHLPMSLIEYN